MRYIARFPDIVCARTPSRAPGRFRYDLQTCHIVDFDKTSIADAVIDIEEWREACPSSALHEDRNHWPAISFKDEIRLLADCKGIFLRRDTEGCSIRLSRGRLAELEHSYVMYGYRFS